MKKEILSQLLRDLADKRPVVLATELASGGARLIHPRDGAEGVAPALVEAARAALARDRSEKVEAPAGTVFLRIFNPPVRVVVVGAVLVAQALARMAQLAGYDVLVVDPRRSFATQERFPSVEIACAWPDEALAEARPDRVRLARNAVGAGRLARPDGSATLDSPLCGDEVAVDVTLAEGRIAALAHRVRGCVLCQAAASVIGRAAPGATAGEIEGARAQLAEMLESGGPAPEGRFAELMTFSPVADVPSRRGCPLLPFDALAQAIARAGRSED